MGSPGENSSPAVNALGCTANGSLLRCGCQLTRGGCKKRELHTNGSRQRECNHARPCLRRQAFVVRQAESLKLLVNYRERCPRQERMQPRRCCTPCTQHRPSPEMRTPCRSPARTRRGRRHGRPTNSHREHRLPNMPCSMHRQTRSAPLCARPRHTAMSPPMAGRCKRESRQAERTPPLHRPGWTAAVPTAPAAPRLLPRSPAPALRQRGAGCEACGTS